MKESFKFCENNNRDVYFSTYKKYSNRLLKLKTKGFDFELDGTSNYQVCQRSCMYGKKHSNLSLDESEKCRILKITARRKGPKKLKTKVTILRSSSLFDKR